MQAYGYWIDLPPNADGSEGPSFAAKQSGPDERVQITTRNGATIWITQAEMISFRTDRDGNEFYTTSTENKKFTALRFEHVPELDDLSPAELSQKHRESIRALQARSAVARAEGASTVGAAIDLTALGAPAE